MSKVKVGNALEGGWQQLVTKYGTFSPEGWILPIHLCTGQLEPKVRFHTAKANPYPAGANITPIPTLSQEGLDDIQEIVQNN